MSAAALVTLERSGAPDVLVDYARFVATLSIGPDAKRLRRNAAGRLLDVHPDLHTWMGRPTPARLSDLRRSGAWSFLTWCFLEGVIAPDLDLMLAKTPGDLYAEWGSRHQGDVDRVVEVARRFDWSDNWTRDVSRAGVAVLCLWANKTLDELTDDDFDAFTVAVDTAPSARRDTRSHNHARAFSLHQACYELGICARTPRKNRPRAATLIETLRALPQPEIRRVVLRYLEIVATTLRSSTVLMKADSLIVFGEYLAANHPDVVRLEQLERAHVDGFLIWNHGRPWRGWLARDKPVAASVSKRAVVDLRAFFEDLAIWGWAERPSGPLVFASDIPRLDRPLPRALAPDADRDLMAAVAGLADPFARAGLTILRGTGMRLGELLDLELDCLWDTPTHGTWVKVPLGKLGTERTVPLDTATLAAFDAWMAHRGRQRPITHPRDGHPAEFLFMDRGRRLSAYKLRHGLDTAVTAARLTGRGDRPLHVTPHQLRHTYATTLVNAGMSLQALMAVLGHVSAEMTLRYASIASPTVRAAYEAAMSKIRTRSALVVAPLGKTAVPDRVDWLRSEMLKTRVAHGYCSRDLVAEACPYANICEQCDNFVTTPEFGPALQAQRDDINALRDDASARGWDSETARHQRVIDRIDSHLRRLKNMPSTGTSS
ncbi:MAG TPA: tyrosine-type recombinase/integrase [Acidimicrobiales bacterium]|nr:tyrosine-type recombinase/integrase [Acidimicrobiales bacterium]